MRVPAKMEQGGWIKKDFSYYVHYALRGLRGTSLSSGTVAQAPWFTKEHGFKPWQCNTDLGPS